MKGGPVNCHFHFRKREYFRQSSIHCRTDSVNTLRTATSIRRHSVTEKPLSNYFG